MLGDRRSYDGELCTVRFVGELPAWPGVVALGVEWDNPARGKNSGDLNGVQYFSCRYNQGAGSFIKASRKHDGTVELAEAIKQKYLESDTTDTAPIRVARSKIIETLGVDKLASYHSQLSNLSTLALTRMYIVSANPDSLSSLNLSSLTRLDLGFNLLTSLPAVAHLTTRITSLRSLILNGNRFEDQSVADPASANTHITELSLATTLLSPTAITAALNLFPGIQSLNLSSNSLACIPSLPALDTLDLSWNSLAGTLHIDDINTKHLYVSHNSIEAIASSASSLSLLDIASNRIAEWSNIDCLASSSIQSLRTSGNPLLSDDPENCTAQIIARAGSIVKLDGSNVTTRDRLNAEIYFMSQVAAGKLSYDTSLLRWQQLCAVHGAPDFRAPEKAVDTKFSDNLIELTIVYDDRRAVLKVRKATTVQRFLAMACKKFGLPASEFTLVLNGQPLDREDTVLSINGEVNLVPL